MRDLSNEEESMKEQDAYSRHMEDLEERDREEKHETKVCPECHGTGQNNEPLWLDMVLNSSGCYRCHGSGEIIIDDERE